MMVSPFGVIVDPNPNHDQVDVWALVLNNVVMNTILASYNDMPLIARMYDYSIDLTMSGDSEAGIGWNYNASDGSFSRAPAPPVDWVENVRNDWNSLISTIQQISIDIGPDAGNLNVNDVTAAYNSSLNDNPNLDVATQNLLTTILNYIKAGG